jgi:hypothetical protein
LLKTKLTENELESDDLEGREFYVLKSELYFYFFYSLNNP